MKLWLGIVLGASLAACGGAAVGSQATVASRDVVDGTNATSDGDFETHHWNDGLDCSAPAPDVLDLSSDTTILRQPLCANFEGPFLYLLFGKKHALLLDSGTAYSDMSVPVMAKVDAYKAAHGLTQYDLIVAHTHSHGDHVGGDRYFTGRAGVRLVGYAPEDVASFFGLGQWPTGASTFDLDADDPAQAPAPGDRVLDVMPLPGHEPAHILVYDRAQKLLLTGDTLYPGRLYIDDWSQYQASVARMDAFANGTGDAHAGAHDVRYVLGAHIELMSGSPARDYAMGASRHANEHAPQLAKSDVAELAQRVAAMGDTPERQAGTNFIIYP